MRGIAFWFLLAATVCGATGMAGGIAMAVTRDHSLATAHAHLNLLGWVSMAIFGFYYHLVPQAAEGAFAKLHLALSLAGTALIVPGIVLVHTGGSESPAKIGAMLSIASILLFLVTVVRHRPAHT